MKKSWLCLLLLAVACASGALKTSTERSVEAIEELAWIAPNVDTVKILTEAPAECLRAPKTTEIAYQVNLGRAGFNNPMLFGGLAARSGLSCASCHRNGHGNENFFFEGLSGEAGTADVTSALFSKTRGDGVFNPVPIPTLVDVSQKSKLGTMKPAESIHDFVDAAVTEEFQGAPPPSVISAITVYLEHLDSRSCPDKPLQRNVANELRLVRGSLSTAQEAISRDDPDAADFLLLASQQSLGRIFQRYNREETRRGQALITALSRKIGAARATVSVNDEQTVPPDLDTIIEQIGTLEASLVKTEEKSFYSKSALEAALNEFRSDGTPTTSSISD